MSALPGGGGRGTFADSQDRFNGLAAFLEGQESGSLTHAELEARLTVDGGELLRQLLQDHLDLRAHGEQRVQTVVDADGVSRGSVEAGHQRPPQTVFGEVKVGRMAYRRRDHPNLYLADAALNLPVERHSHGLRRLAAGEAARGSFADAVQAVERATGQHVAKRQAEALAQRASGDFEAFYAQRSGSVAEGGVLVLSCDGKGIVMRPEALREAMANKAATARTKLATRLSKGEKRNRKRMAGVGAVYDATPAPRTPDDVLTSSDDDREVAPGPVAKNSWLTGSVAQDAAVVVTTIFDEADRRDPKHRRSWVALVDGNNHQIDRIRTEAGRRGVTVRIVIDFIHVLEYLWKAAWCFFDEGDPDAEPGSARRPWPSSKDAPARSPLPSGARRPGTT